MNIRALTTPRVRRTVVRHGYRLSLRALAAWMLLGLGAILLFLTVFLLVFGDALLNRYGKARMEQAFAGAYPGCELRLGRLRYSPVANRLSAQSAILRSSTVTLKTGASVLSGVPWAQYLWSGPALTQALAGASMAVTNLELEVPAAQYGIRCERLLASVPDSSFSAEGIELRTLLGDEAFFAAHAFRKTRLQLIIPECKASGLAYDELLQGRSYRARSIQIIRPSFEALVNRDKPAPPFVKSPLMVHEALATLPKPLQIGNLTITNGTLRYCEQMVVGAEPGVLTFGDVGITVEDMDNRADASAAIRVRAQGNFMNAGVLQVLMTIPITPPDFSLHYSGSLSAMDLTRLDAFLEIAEHTRIKSGSALQATFDIQVTSGQASGWVRATYADLVIAVLNKQTGSENRLDHRIVSLLANLFALRSSNVRDASGQMKEGKVNHTRAPEEEFLEFVWSALKSGVLDILSH